MENIHNETYSIMIESLIENQDEKDKLFNSIKNFKCMYNI